MPGNPSLEVPISTPLKPETPSLSYAFFPLWVKKLRNNSDMTNSAF
jgi:hypothetical protein